MKYIKLLLVFSVFNTCFISNTWTQSQSPSVKASNIHKELELVPVNKMQGLPGLMFKQTGFERSSMAAQLTSVFMWVQAFSKYTWEPKIQIKFLSDLDSNYLTEFLNKFALDTRDKQLMSLKFPRYKDVTWGKIKLVQIGKLKGIEFPYSFERDETKTLTKLGKTHFKGKRILLFSEFGVADLRLEWLEDANNWSSVLAEQMRSINFTQ